MTQQSHSRVYIQKRQKLNFKKDTCTPVFIAALFTIAKTWKQPKCPSTDGWIKKMWYICIYTTEYYSGSAAFRGFPSCSWRMNSLREWVELALLLKIVVEIFVFLFYCITYLTNNDLSVSLCKFGFGGVGNIKKREIWTLEREPAVIRFILCTRPALGDLHVTLMILVKYKHSILHNTNVFLSSINCAGLVVFSLIKTMVYHQFSIFLHSLSAVINCFK